MRKRLAFGMLGLALLGGAGVAHAQSSPESLNPVIALLEEGKPVFGLYAPRPDRGDQGDSRTAADFARETVGYQLSDYVFNSSMEGGVERGLPAFTEFMAAMKAAGGSAKTHPFIVKTAEIAPDMEKAAADIGRQLNAGVSGVMFVKAESAEEVRRGIAAMRFRSDGGTRPDDVGDAPAYWGTSEEEYRERADLWPLDPNGELINWTIVESREGLENVREIAAVPGVGVLWPGAGTLRGVFSTTGADGERVVDTEAWEAAIQKVLAACKEFDVPCGFPAGPDDIEMRMEQGFSVFVMNWGENGFRTIEIGRRLSGR